MTVLRTILISIALSALAVEAQTTVPTVSQAIPSQVLTTGGGAAVIALSSYFTVPGVSGQVVQFDTVLGKFNVELRSDAAPQHVSNFLGYVQRGNYSSSFIHRSAALDQSGAISIVQGGGYTATSAGVANVPTQSSVPLEYNLPNERGTLAAARTTDINSATSQWYFNVRDNSSLLGQSNGGGYTVFGRVIGSGMSVVDAIAALPRVNAGSPFDELPVRDYSSGNVQLANLVLINSITAVPVFPSGSGASAVTFAVDSSASNVVSASLNGSQLVLTPAGAGTATVTVRATDVNGNATTSSFAVTVTNSPPSFVVQPRSLTAAAGDTTVLTATVAAATSYQWQRGGADIAGATNATLVLSNVSAANAGNYTLVARNVNGNTTSSTASLTVTTPSADEIGRLANLSIRTNAGTGDQTLIVGFALGGANTNGNAPLLLRGMGPSLAQFGLSGYLADPVATLYSGNTAIVSNDNWGGDGQVQARVNQVQAFGFAATGSLDAALATSPDAGGYTMQITGKGGATGTVLAEIYDANISGGFVASSPRLINVSARAQVGTGDNILIAGFVVRGNTARTVLVRASGPALAQFNVGGTLTDPKLQITAISNGALMAENDNWGGDTQVAVAAAGTGAFPWTNPGGKDAAILLTLPPGSYTAQVSGLSGGTGIALVEVYEVR